MNNFAALLNMPSTNIDVPSTLISMVITLVMALLVFFVYRITYNGVAYSQKFNASIVMITLITAIIMAVIQSNLALSLGMVGALSIIRFRTAIKDPRDTAFIFWGIVVGLSCGTRNYIPGVIGSIVIAIVVCVFSFMFKSKSKFVLVVRTKGETDANVIEKTVEQSVSSSRLCSVNTNKQISEYVFEIKSSDSINTQVIENLYNVEGTESVNIVSEISQPIL